MHSLIRIELFVLAVTYVLTYLKTGAFCMRVFGFTVVWIVRIVRIGCKSFLFSTQIGMGGALGDLSPCCRNHDFDRG